MTEIIDKYRVFCPGHKPSLQGLTITVTSDEDSLGLGCTVYCNCPICHTDNTEGDFIKFVRNGNQVIFEKLVTASNKVPAFSGEPSPMTKPRVSEVSSSE